MKKDYKKLIENIIEEHKYEELITTNIIANKLADILKIEVDEIKDIVNLNMKRIADEDKIYRVKRGIYVKVKNTILGKSKVPIDVINIKLCTKDEDQIIGYIGEELLMHQLGLTTLVPKNMIIITNKYRTLIKNNNLILKKPVTEINNENFRYLQIVDAIKLLDKDIVNVENPYYILKKAIEKFELDIVKLIMYAKKFYTDKIVLKVVDVIADGGLK